MTKRRIKNKYTSTYPNQHWTSPIGAYRVWKEMDRDIERLKDWERTKNYGQEEPKLNKQDRYGRI